MVTTDTSSRQRPQAATLRARHAHRLDPSPVHWIERQRQRRPEGWCARLRDHEAPAAAARGRLTSIEWW